jgi:acetylglutamate kinase
MGIDLKQVVVIKLGGSILDSKDTTVHDLVELQKAGQPLILIHGGASMVNQWLAEQGVESQFHQGERITDRKSLDVVTAVLAGLANKETVSAIIAAGGMAVGISGVDGALIQARIRELSLGYIGSVVKIDPALLSALLDAGFIPVISPVSLRVEEIQDGEPLLLNVNGDTAAGELAAGISARMLVFLTDVNGIHDSFGHKIAQLSINEVRTLLDTGVASGGMIPKLKACLVAAKAGVSCSITDGRRLHALVDEVSGKHSGTVILSEKIR